MWGKNTWFWPTALQRWKISRPSSVLFTGHRIHETWRCWGICLVLCASATPCLSLFQYFWKITYLIVILMMRLPVTVVAFTGHYVKFYQIHLRVCVIIRDFWCCALSCGWCILLLPRGCVTLAVGHAASDLVQNLQMFSKLPSLKLGAVLSAWTRGLYERLSPQHTRKPMVKKVPADSRQNEMSPTKPHDYPP